MIRSDAPKVVASIVAEHQESNHAEQMRYQTQAMTNPCQPGRWEPSMVRPNGLSSTVTDHRKEGEVNLTTGE